MSRDWSSESATLITQEKEAKQHLDRVMHTFQSHSESDPATAVQAEVDEARRQWEAARKRLELFQAERSV